MHGESLLRSAPGSAGVWVRRLLGATVIMTYALIVLGGIVRISGSGLGCGNDWPLCHGRIVPLFSFETLEMLIEYGHRITAATVSVLVVACAVATWMRARWLFGAALLALGLLIVQISLGAITVKVDLQYWAVVPHLGTAMAILG